MSTSSGTQVGILGGTFNPVHLGHLVMAQDALELFGLAHVLFVPCAVPPHKTSPDLAPTAHRVAMLEAATEGDHRFSVSDIEIRRGGTSYAIDTVHELSAIHPDWMLRFIVGSDSLHELHLWKDIHSLLEICEFRIFERPGYPVTDHAGNVRAALPSDKLRASSATGHLVKISSTDIRHRIAEGLSIRYLVPPAVEMYIVTHSLYAT